MSKTFVPFTGQINAFAAPFIWENGVLRPAETRGGWQSQTGLTAEPQWVEAGFIPGFRRDAIREQKEFPPEFVVFEGHGTAPVKPQLIGQDFQEDLEAWRAWRRGDNDAQPQGWRLAQWASRSYEAGDAVAWGGLRLTDGEALGLSRFEGATMTIHDPDSEGDVLEEIRADRYYAYRWVWADGDRSIWRVHACGDRSKVELDGWEVTYLSLGDRVVASKRRPGSAQVWDSSRSVKFHESWSGLMDGPWELVCRPPEEEVDWVEVEE